VFLLGSTPAWAYFSLNPPRCGMTMAVDGQETWNIQNYSYPGETGLDHLDRDWVIRWMGEILWGNIGAADRLDFTAIGSAVNRVSQIEGLYRPLGQ
jgi:hypothetical protein